MKKSITTFFGTATLILLGLISTLTVYAQSGTWSLASPMIEPRGFTQAAVINGKLYVPEGRTSAATLNGVEIYDPANDNWSVTSGSPTGLQRAGSSVGAIDNKLYVAGGWFNSDSNAPSSALEIYDPQVDAWMTAQPTVIPRGAAASAVLNGQFYITGGRAYVWIGDIASLEIYDPVTNTVTSSDDANTGIPAIPKPTDDAAGVALDGKFYVLGGNNLPPNSSGRPCSVYPQPCQTVLSDMYIYDPNSKTWSQGPSMPGPRWNHVAAVMNGKIYVTGGQSSNENGIPDTSLWIYDPQQQSWSIGPDTLSPHVAGVAGVVNSELIVAGGIFPDNPATEVFSPAPSYSAQVQPPINANESSIFNANRGVVPVKFILTQNGNPTCTLLPATIAVTRTSGGTTGTINESIYSMSADSGSNFRIDSCQYVYNLNARALGAGTYRVDIAINNEIVGSGVFQLK